MIKLFGKNKNNNKILTNLGIENGRGGVLLVISMTFEQEMGRGSRYFEPKNNWQEWSASTNANSI